MDILGQKRVILLSQDPDAPVTDPSAEESVFSACVSPSELYQELVSSYCATCVVDVSPGQGEFLKACLALRTKAVAICGTDAHASRLELSLTDYILTELSREGSTFYRPESVPKEVSQEGEDIEPKPKKKPRTETKGAETKAEKKKRGRKPKGGEEEHEGGEEGTDDSKKKKPKKGTEPQGEDGGEDEEDGSEDCW